MVEYGLSTKEENNKRKIMATFPEVTSITQKSLLTELKSMKSKVLHKFVYFRHWDFYRQILDAEQCNSRIAELIQGQEPAMISRFGSTELSCVQQYLKGYYEKETINYMHHWSGFFPTTKEALDRYCELFLESTKLIDMLGVWFLESEAEIVQRYSEKLPSIVNLVDLEPYFHKNPWSQHLEGKKVLVIHPFAETIVESYYHSRDSIFEDKSVLPAFDLDAIKAIQSVAGNTDGFGSWFEAYDWLCEQVTMKEFDVAILGCGSYGLPLAGFIKSLSKKAIHLGGTTQILFGIKGRRWDARPAYQALYNSSWVRAAVKETPSNHTLVEGGCYW
jgi:hypothetical protein